MTLTYELDPANKFKEQLRRTGIFVLDVETKKRDTFDGRDLLGVAVGIPDGLDLTTFYFSPEEFAEIHELLQGKEMIGFSLMFDLQILEENGYVHNGFVWDVLVLSHMANSDEFDYSLDALSKKYLKTDKGLVWGEQVVDIKKLEKIFGWDDIPFIMMGAYAQQDITLTYQLFLRVRGEIEKQNLSNVYRAYERYIKALQHLTQEGILVDWDLLEKLQVDGRRQMAEIEAEIGFEPGKRKMLEHLLYEELNLPVLKKTKGGGNATDTEALNRLSNRHPEYRHVLESVLTWRNLQKADSTWYTGFKLRRTSAGRIHPGIKIHGTKTGRLSGAEPNLQQVPREEDRVKKVFISPPGHVLVEFDYAAMELRLASFYAMKIGADPTMYELFAGELDPHHATAETIGAYDQINDSGTARQVGKTSNFSYIYGVGADTFVTQLYRMYTFDCSLEQAEQWKERFHAAYPGFRRAARRYEQYAKRFKHIELWNKRRCHFPHEDATYKAFNYLVQGGCSQVLLQATVVLSERIKRGELDARLCNTVHDSLWIYIPEDSVDIATKQIIDVMQTPPSKRWGIEFSVEAKQLNKEG